MTKVNNATRKALAANKAKATKAKPRPGSAAERKASKARLAKEPTMATLRKLNKAKPDEIISVSSATGADAMFVTNGAGDSFSFSRAQYNKAAQERSRNGMSYKAFVKWLGENPAPKPGARLARGLSGKDAPHSALAAAESRKGDKATAPAKKGKAEKRATEPKAGKNKQPSRGANRAYKPGKKQDTSKPDTFRRYMLTTILKHKDTDSAKAAHAKSGKYPTHKLDFNWSAQQGYITFTDK